MAYTLRQRATAVTELCDEIVRYWGSKDFTGYTNQVVPLWLDRNVRSSSSTGISVWMRAAGSALALGVGFCGEWRFCGLRRRQGCEPDRARSKNKSITTE